MNLYPNMPVNTIDLRRLVDELWNALQTLIRRLSREQLTSPTDAAGWTVKDHLIHISVWEVGLAAWLSQESFVAAMGVHVPSWNDSNIDEINADIQRRHRDLPLDEVLEAMALSHARVLAHIDLLADDELMRPARKFEPHSDPDAPLIHTIVGNTFGHYAEHIPWIEAIVAAVT